LALLFFGLEAASEDGAVLYATGGVGAGVYGGLEGFDVPASDEIGVVSVACFSVS
jgi:hypothetical protein